MDIKKNKAVWKKTLAQIEIKLNSDAHFQTWFKDTRLIEIKGGNAKIGVKNSYTADWLSKKHNTLIKDTLSFVLGKDVTLKFVYDKTIVDSQIDDLDNEKPILKVKDGIDEDTHKRIENANLNDKYSFSNFVVGASNRLAHAACTSVADNPGTSYNPLFLYAPTGLGKTHLIQAIGRKILDEDPTKKVLYCSTENFLNDMVMSIQTNKMQKFRDKYRKLDLLIIDDIHQISNAKETQNEFFNTFNVLFQESKQIVITSDRMPDEIPNVEDRLVSRFKGGMVADISKPIFEERVAILKQKSNEYAISLPENTVKYIAEIINSNIRALEGALQKINLYNSVKRDHELTLAEVAKILGQDAKSKRDKVDLSDILKHVADEFDVHAKDLKGPRRTKDIAFARQVSMYILRTEYGYKLQKIAEIHNRKDHTTALHAIDKIESKIQTNLTLKDQIDNIIEKINRFEEE